MSPDDPRRIEFSVVVPAYKSLATISACLEALLAQETDLAYEVIVVESSGDGTAKLVREQFPGVRVIESAERMLSGAARNRGAEEASGEILGFVDSDCIVEKQWLTKMWRMHCEHDCAAVGGAVINGNPHLSISISSYLNEFSDFYQSGSPRYVGYLSTCHIAYKTEVFRRFGGFGTDEPLYVDLIFNTTLSKSGEKLLFMPGIRGSHLHRTTLGAYLRHEKGRGRAAAIARRRGLLIGASWAKHPTLALMITPGLFLRKATVFPYRFFRAYPMQVLRLIRALPCFHLALMVWHYGFLKEVFAGSASESEEEAAKCASN